jgi:hypothetical protein
MSCAGSTTRPPFTTSAVTAKPRARRPAGGRARPCARPRRS